LLGVHSRCGLHTRTATKSWLALPTGFSQFVTSLTAPVASGWSISPGGIRTHWKAPPLHGAHPLRVSRLAETDKAISAKAANALHPKDLGSA